MSIRPATAADLPEMREIYRPFVERTAVSFEYQVPTPEEFFLRFTQHIAQFPWLVWEEQGRVLGYAYAGAPWERAAYRWCAESSVYLAPEARGRGVGKALYQALEDILRRQGYRTLYALVTTDNEASIGFHEAIGFVRRAFFFPTVDISWGPGTGSSGWKNSLRPRTRPHRFRNHGAERSIPYEHLRIRRRQSANPYRLSPGAHQLGHCLAKAGFGLVFGGGNTGVMGACARGAAQAGGQILGVAPSFFNQEGVLYPSCTTLHLTDTMRQRKEMMEHLSHGFVMAPGGIGTLEEFFEILTLKQLGRHKKPIAVLNIRGYFDALEELLEGAVEEGF